MFQITQKTDSSKKKDSDSSTQQVILNNAEMTKGHEMASMLGAPAQLMEEEEEMVQPKLTKAAPLQMQEEEEELLQAKLMGAGPVQFMVEEEEENIQAKLNSYNPVQFQEEEEEEIQPKLAKNSSAQMMEEEEELPAQGKVLSSSTAQLKEGATNSIASASSGTATSLPKDVNAKMESSFGTSFANVNIHKNSEKATQLGALAYTQGDDVHFAPGQYNPSSTKGQELIGHELTHVVQQRADRVNGIQNKGGITVNTDKSLEKEADVMGAKAAQGKGVDVKEKGRGIQKQDIIDKLYEELTSWKVEGEIVFNHLKLFIDTPEAIAKIKDRYRVKYGISLEAQIISKLKDEYKSKILELLKKDTGKYNVGLEEQHEVVASGNIKKATTFKGLVRLVRLAEDKLIQAGFTSVEERIKILRGIYYGTEWSMDYNKEKSETRNIGFDVYTGTVNRPANPRKALGEKLFLALRNTPEIKGRNRSVDFGHLIIGLDSRTNIAARNVDLPVQGGSGLEAVTWLGDLGGGVGMVCMKRIYNPKVRSKPIVFNSGGHDYGALVNLEGDIAGYAVANDSDDSVSYPDIKKYGYISDAMSDYLLLQDGKTSEKWNNRVENFTRMIGGKIESGKITNASELVIKLTQKLADFGGMYALVRMKDKGTGTEKNYRVASKHIIGAAKEVAMIFVYMLQSNISGINKKLVATYDPAPRPMGKEYGVLKNAANGLKNAKSLKEKIKHYYNEYR